METFVKTRTSRSFEKELQRLSEDLEALVLEMISGEDSFFLPRIFTPDPTASITHRDEHYPLAVLVGVSVENAELTVEDELGGMFNFQELPLETQLEIFRWVEQHLAHKQYLQATRA